MLVFTTLVDAMWNHFGFGQTAQLPTSADRLIAAVLLLMVSMEKIGKLPMKFVLLP